MSTILKLDKLSKHYGSVQALREVTLEIPQGAVYGLLGPNGSGKTTLLSIILGVVNASSGSFRWEGKPEGVSSARVSALLEKPNFLPANRIDTQLEMLAIIRNIPASERERRVTEVLRQTGILDARSRPFRTLSLGMKQRLGIAAVLLSNPEVLVLDEPTNGLDPQGIIDIRNLILELGSQGRTIILASHILDEIEKVCTHAAILKKGELIKTEVIREKVGVQQEFVLELGIEAGKQAELEKVLSAYEHCTAVNKSADGLYLTAAFGAAAGGASEINRMLAGHGLFVSELRAQRAALEASFLKAVGDSK